jgi:hypothetical protein
MIKAELIKRSPLRILEKSIHGGLGKGNIGVLAARKGVGKTACLVHISTDKLLQDKPVIHVSYAKRVDYIIRWYEDIFKEIAKKRELESAMDVYDKIIKNRVIMNFTQDMTHTDRILQSVGALIECGNITADAIIVDGYDHTKSTIDDFKKFKTFAQKLNLEVWFSASLKGKEPLFDPEGMPNELKDYSDSIDVLIALAYQGDHVHLTLVKNHDHPSPGDLKVKLDPKTLLISE